MTSTPVAAPPFVIDAVADGSATRLTVRRDRQHRDYVVTGGEHDDYVAFFNRLADDFGTRRPNLREAPPQVAPVASNWQPLIVANLSPLTTAGYGDPAVLKTDDGYILVATSNDAPDAFPILRSHDLKQWTHEGVRLSRRGRAGMGRAWA